MAVEQVTHTSLSAHSPPFSLNGATSYSVDAQGTMPDGGLELQMLQNGYYVSLNPSIKFAPSDAGGTKLTGLLPAAAKFRWTVNSRVVNTASVNTKITASH